MLEAELSNAEPQPPILIKLFDGGREKLKPRPHTVNPIKPEAFPHTLALSKMSPPAEHFLLLWYGWHQ